MKSRYDHRIPVLVMAALVASFAVGEESRWRKFPMPPGRSGTIQSIALEGDTLWAMANNSVFYWDGQQWSKPDGPTLRGGVYLTTLVGGGDRPVYCTQPGSQPGSQPGLGQPGTGPLGIGHLYRLSDGTAKRIAEFPYTRSTQRPIMFVARSGIILHRMRGSLRILHDGQWSTIATPEAPSSVIEVGTTVCVCFPSESQAFLVHGDGTNARIPLELQIPDPRRRVRLFRWGTMKALAFQSGNPPFQCVDLTDGHAVDVSAITEELTGIVLENGFETRDGSVWILGRRRRSRNRELFRITPDGKVESVVNLNEAGINDLGLGSTPRRFLHASDDSLWFGLRDGIVRLQKGKFSTFGSDTGFKLTDVQMQEDPSGTIYAVNSNLYGYFSEATPPAALTAPVAQPEREEVRWRFTHEARYPLQGAWFDGRSVYLTGANRPISAVATSDGAERFSVQPGEDNSNQFAGSRWPFGQDDSTLHFFNGKVVFFIDVATGNLERFLPIPHDHRIAPIKIPTGYVVVPRYRGYEIQAVQEDGTTIWQKSLPGYVMGQPAVDEEYAVIQTRASSYGGQATLAIDLKHGTVLWNDRTDAYGQGVFVDKSLGVVIETDAWLSPKRTEAWIVCRNLEDGSRRWHYRDDEQRPSAPIVDRERGRVYCAMSRGKVVCLDIDDGQLIWEREFPESLSSQGGTSPYFPTWTPHSLQKEKLLIVDENMTLHVLEPRSGELITSVAIATPTNSGNVPQKLIASPWLTDDGIIAAFEREVIAIPIPDALRAPPSEPRLAQSRCTCRCLSCRPTPTVCRNTGPIRRLLSRLRFRR